MKTKIISSRSSQSPRWLVLLFALLGVGSLSCALGAIPITNPGFEADPVADLSTGDYRINVTTDSNYKNPVATGWVNLFTSTTTYGDQVAAIQDLSQANLVHNPDGSLSTTADDNNVGALGSTNRFSQALATTFAANVDYSLSIRAARLTTQSTFPGGRLLLGYGSATSFTTLASVINTDTVYGQDALPDAASGEWTTITLNYSTLGSGPELGQNIVVAFQGNSVPGTPHAYIDDFVLIPEPTTVALWGLGAALWLIRRRV
ncbi:MAG TPA: PEP-CTERM sorting domain-containing protein [Nitrospiraceae bacterium]|jgi:hypothetical protein